MSDLQLLRADLDELNATSVQRARFEENVPKARAAIAKALERQAKNPLSYALSIFGSDEPARKEQTANRSVTRDCETCGGDRFVIYSERPAPNGYYEEFAPCPACNASCNTVRLGFASPSPDRVRERLAAA